jgi:CDP-glucose 4,6-dehydratase
MKFFITGHTGFKGSWFVLMLQSQGHEVMGYSLDPLKDGIFVSADVGGRISRDTRGDIRDVSSLENALRSANPDVVVHMAAQPLVRASYENPAETFEINVTGTLNVLKAIRKSVKPKAIAVITTDKVYRNLGEGRPYSELDALGSGDPYSTSKAMADLLAQTWAKNVTNSPVGIFRAGNVIGGGDVSENRLIPDIVRSQKIGNSVKLRNPSSIRPWQHVLDCLYGYKAAIEWMLAKGESTILNFGPPNDVYRTVGEVATKYLEISKGGDWILDQSSGFPEANFLALDSSKARQLLGWSDIFSLEETLTATHDWYSAQSQSAEMFEFTKQQIENHRMQGNFS